jgi:hypothetical protein
MKVKLGSAHKAHSCIVEGGNVDAELLVTIQTTHRIKLLGPTFGSYSRQRLVGQGYDLGTFVIDSDAKLARCPQGQTGVKVNRFKTSEESRNLLCIS